MLFPRFCIGGGDCFCDQSPICTQKGKKSPHFMGTDGYRALHTGDEEMAFPPGPASSHSHASVGFGARLLLAGAVRRCHPNFMGNSAPRSKRINKMLYYNNLTCYYLAVGDLKSAAACFQDGEQTIEKTSKTSLFFVAPIILICSTPKRSCSTIKVRFKRAKSFFCRRSKGGIQIQQLAVTSI